MGFLNQLLKYKKVCIQCHNCPDADALAAAYGVYTYLKLHDIKASIIYGGEREIQKKDLLYMLNICPTILRTSRSRRFLFMPTMMSCL